MDLYRIWMGVCWFYVDLYWLLDGFSRVFKKVCIGLRMALCGLLNGFVLIVGWFVGFFLMVLC